MARRPPDPASHRAETLSWAAVEIPGGRGGALRRRLVQALGLDRAGRLRAQALEEELARARHAERLLMRVHAAAERVHDDWLADTPLDEAIADLRSELRTAAELTS